MHSPAGPPRRTSASFVPTICGSPTGPQSAVSHADVSGLASGDAGPGGAASPLPPAARRSTATTVTDNDRKASTRVGTVEQPEALLQAHERRVEDGDVLAREARPHAQRLVEAELARDPQQALVIRLEERIEERAQVHLEHHQPDRQRHGLVEQSVEVQGTEPGLRQVRDLHQRAAAQELPLQVAAERVVPALGAVGAHGERVAEQRDPLEGGSLPREALDPAKGSFLARSAAVPERRQLAAVRVEGCAIGARTRWGFRPGRDGGSSRAAGTRAGRRRPSRCRCSPRSRSRSGRRTRRGRRGCRPSRARGGSHRPRRRSRPGSRRTRPSSRGRRRAGTATPRSAPGRRAASPRAAGRRTPSA